jgi:hypothetical protein
MGRFSSEYSLRLSRSGRGRWRRPRRFLMLGAMLAMMLAPQVWSREASKEDRIKAAFLYNFTKFVEWPAERFPEEDTAVTIGVLGDALFANVLEETVRGRMVNGRPVEVVRLEEARQMDGVHVVFLAGSEKRCGVEFSKMPVAGVLTVGECAHAMPCGAVIHFRIVGDKVRFEIDVAAAEERTLKVSAHLQKLAMKVHRKGAD